MVADPWVSGRKTMVMLQKILSFVAAGAIGLMGATGALAQDATPASGGLFASLGLPELTVTMSAEGLSIDQAEIAAGRYLGRVCK